MQGGAGGVGCGQNAAARGAWGGAQLCEFREERVFYCRDKLVILLKCALDIAEQRLLLIFSLYSISIHIGMRLQVRSGKKERRREI